MSNAWKRSAKTWRWLAKTYMDLCDVYFAKVGQARAWAGIWKTMAKAYRARYTRWIDPAVELPTIGLPVVAILRRRQQVELALIHYRGNGVWYRQYKPDWYISLESEHVIGWHPLPDLSRVDNATGQT